MKTQLLGNSSLPVSQIGLGCMRMAALNLNEACNVIQTALNSGINFFDHADIYGGGKSESIFGEAIRTLGIQRMDIIIQSKIGIRPELGLYDFSFDHITTATDGILKRLQTDYLDILLLHRPDALMDPKEVARALNALHESHKVRHFGVSNFTPLQIELLQRELNFPLLVNQVQFSLMHAALIDEGIQYNTYGKGATPYTHGMIDYSRIKGITLQAWSPFQFGTFEGTFIDNPQFPELNQTLEAIATRYNVSKTTIAAAWILRHPARIQIIAGSMNPDRIQDIARSVFITLTAKEWYDLYKSASALLP